MKQNRTPWLFLLPLLIASVSCKKTEYFKSESSIKESLQGDWNLILIPRTNPPETWTFIDGNLTHVVQPHDGSPELNEKGSYEVNTSLLKVEIKISNLPVTTAHEDLNGTWQVVSLDKHYLVMAKDQDGSGMLEREFEKKN